MVLIGETVFNVVPVRGIELTLGQHRITQLAAKFFQRGNSCPFDLRHHQVSQLVALHGNGAMVERLPKIGALNSAGVRWVTDRLRNFSHTVVQARARWVTIAGNSGI